MAKLNVNKMRVNQKGQMIVLDVLFALALIIFAFLLIFKISEVEIYTSVSQRKIEQLNRVGDLAYLSLKNNTEYGCFVSDTQNKFFLPGTMKDNVNITKSSLSIPADYNCSLSISGISFTTNECNSVVPTSGDIYAIDFNITNCSTDLTKQAYLTCIKSGICPGITEESGTLKIWRAN